jgi:GNAT superfamily N-acetyltransferase
MPLEILPVRSRRDLSRFIELPYRLHANEPRWIPPLRLERRLFLSRRQNPFFKNGEAEYLLALRDGRVVGRMSAHFDRALNEFQGNRWGMFGFFECEEDQEAATALLRAGETWLEGKGLDRAVGPMDFRMNDEPGLLVEGYDRDPMIRQPWHPPYYRELLEGAGYSKVVDLYFWELYIGGRDKVLPVIWELAEKVGPEHGITIRHMRKRDAKAEMRRFADIFNVAWKDNWGFAPYSDADVAELALDLRLFMFENWTWVAEDADGKPIAAAITPPDLNQMLKKMNGRLLPTGWVHYLRRRKIIDRVRVGWLGVLPEYQHTGVAAALYKEHFDMAAKTPQTWGEMGWILETNEGMNRGMEGMGGERVKCYRMFERVFAAAGTGPGRDDGSAG